MSDAPERIWPSQPDAHDFSEEPPARSNRYVEYIRADLHAAVVAERDALAARVKALEGEAALLRGEWRRIVAEITGNQSAMRCDACRAVGSIHCPEAFYDCSGMRDYTAEEVLTAFRADLSTVKQEGGE